MRLPNFKKIRLNYLLLAFLLPVIGMFTVMIIRGFIPFGKLSMLYSDMYHQYYPFFLAFRKALLSGESLLYSWSVGMGIDYLGLISYYLASPLNLLSILVPESLLLHYFSLLSPIKLGFAGLFFAYFLKKLFGKNDFSISVFGCLYALCAWALGYQWNVMWLDTFALLPLVALGTVSLLKEKKVFLYTFTLFLSVFCNYYIGLFICIFVALIFLCYEICRWGGIKKFLLDLGRIALFSVLAIGMTAILELPAFAALQSTQSSINTFPKKFALNITDDDTWQGLLDAMRQVAGNMNGGLTPTFKEGLPNLYCGIGTTILAFLFLTCRQVRLRDKLACVLLLVFFNISFIIRQLDYIWHGFHFTNMIPYRFSFLYSFVMLYMAYRAWLLRRHFRLWQILVAGGMAIGIAFCANDLSNLIYWAYNGALLLLYIAVLVYPHLFRKPAKTATFAEKRAFVTDRRFQRRICSGVILGFFVAELGLTLLNFGAAFTGTSITNYPRGTEHTASLVRYMYQREPNTPFFRAEVTHSQTLNDGALNGYNGISAFTSSANVRVTRFMKALGYGAKDSYNRYCFEESSPVSNLFLNLKYMLERQDKVEENPYFDQVHQYGKVHLLENNAYLPLGFMADSGLQALRFSTSGSNTLAFQNQLFSAATGLDDDVWTLITGKNLTISATGATLQTQTQTGYCYYTTEPNVGGTIVYKYTAPKEGFVCTDLTLSKKNKFSFWKNGVELYNETYSLPQSLALCQVIPGDVIEVHLTCKGDEKGSITLHTGILDEDLFRKGYDLLADTPLEITTFRNTLVEGTVNCKEAGILYTSIPQDGNWTATVDGQLAEIQLIGDAMVGLQLTPGTHTVRFTYRNEAFNLGWKISLICTALFFTICFCLYPPRRKRGKYEKY